jgi:hypothetical protein
MSAEPVDMLARQHTIGKVDHGRRVLSALRNKVRRPWGALSGITAVAGTTIVFVGLFAIVSAAAPANNGNQGKGRGNAGSTTPRGSIKTKPQKVKTKENAGPEPAEGRPETGRGPDTGGSPENPSKPEKPAKPEKPSKAEKSPPAPPVATTTPSITPSPGTAPQPGAPTTRSPKNPTGGGGAGTRRDGAGQEAQGVAAGAIQGVADEATEAPGAGSVAANATGGDQPGLGRLPFTGLQALGLVLVGLGLTGLGLTLRRRLAGGFPDD